MGGRTNLEWCGLTFLPAVSIIDTMENVKVALVHDWLTGRRGGEKVLEVFSEIFPEAPIYTLIHFPGSQHPDIERKATLPQIWVMAHY